MLSRFFQESDHLLALYAGESLGELLDRITRLQMIEQLFTGTRVPVKTGSAPRISGSCDTTLLTLARTQHCSDRKIDVLPRLIPQLSTIGHQPSIISRLRCMRCTAVVAAVAAVSAAVAAAAIGCRPGS